MCKPLVKRTANLDVLVMLERAEKLLGDHKWSEATEILLKIKEVPLARPLLVKALEGLEDARRMITLLWPPKTNSEAVLIGGAIIENGSREEGEAFLGLELVSTNADASVCDISNRIRERKLK